MTSQAYFTITIEQHYNFLYHGYNTRLRIEPATLYLWICSDPGYNFKSKTLEFHFLQLVPSLKMYIFPTFQFTTLFFNFYLLTTSEKYAKYYLTIKCYSLSLFWVFFCRLKYFLEPFSVRIATKMAQKKLTKG